MDSDIDLLVEFRTPVSLFDLAHMEDELEHKLGAPVDLLTPASISPHLRADVFRTAIPVYGA